MLAAAGPGCATHTGSQGQRGTSASYPWWTLRADLPGSTRVPEVMVAAESPLVQRGYAIAARTVTEDQGRIEGLPPHGDSDEAVTIVSKVRGNGTRVTVEVGRWGDEEASRAILDAMLMRLGI